jgi:ADP-ribose pyrophosphatase YjhB (NUDIX family)
MADNNAQRPPLVCVKCASASLVKEGQKAYRCQACDFVYFHNAAAAVCALIVCNGQLLLVKRAQQPGKGSLDLPGGFVDYDESNEQALKRELVEELQLPVLTMQYLSSYPNQYFYKDVLYHTVDSFFVINLSSKPNVVLQQSEVSALEWVDLHKIQLDTLAFESGRNAIKYFLTAK